MPKPAGGVVESLDREGAPPGRSTGVVDPRTERWRLAGLVVRDYDYDDRGRLTLDRLTDSGSVMAETVYGYGADGNLELQDITMAGNTAAGTHTYTYDNAGRLESWTHDGTLTDVDWKPHST